MAIEELIIAKAAMLNGCSSEEHRVNTAVLFVANDLYAALEKISSTTQDKNLLWWQIEARNALTPNANVTDLAPEGDKS